ncbi:MAG: MBL fold metallo-hydrolase [Deltaproteobacteria bacterium]|nr:MBL fold metallo-hydrolase [Deltaproteobacteria bacterium]
MVHLIDGGYANTFLIEGDGVLAAVDVGTVLAAEMVEKYITNTLKWPDSSLALITATHFLAVLPLRRWLFNLIPVVAGIDHQRRNLYQGMISGKDGIPLPLFRKSRPDGYTFRCALSETTEIPRFSEWRVCFTPGHTPESICFYHEKDGILISGDTILNMKGTGEVNSFCCNSDDIRRSFERLAVLPVQRLCPGHGKPLNGKDLMGAIRRF